MSQPVLEYFWIKVLDDGVTCIPEFDLETGKTNRWGTDDVKLSKIIYAPFSNELAAKVLENGTAALATNSPVCEVALKDGEHGVAGKEMDLIYEDYFECTICGFSFQHKTAGKFAVCPQCGTFDEWFCNRCQDYKENPVRNNRGETNCPDCDVPHGLNREIKLIRKSRVEHIPHYYIQTDRFRITLHNDGKITVV